VGNLLPLYYEAKVMLNNRNAVMLKREHFKTLTMKMLVKQKEQQSVREKFNWPRKK